MACKQSCIVPSCPDFSSTISEVDFFYLPMDKKKAQVWLSLLHRTDLTMESDGSYDFHRVCARHFTNKQYSSNSNFNRPKLLPGAVPDRALPTSGAKSKQQSLLKSNSPGIALKDREPTIPTVTLDIKQQERQVATGADAKVQKKGIIFFSVLDSILFVCKCMLNEL